MAPGNNINWNNLTDGLSFYKGRGYKYMEVPWIVPKEITKITFKEDNAFTTSQGDLIGSGEQSFLDLLINQNLASGKYCCLTPCFRDEEVNYLHKKHFMKLELFISGGNKKDLERMIKSTEIFFSKKLESKVNVHKIDHNSYDIVFKNVELGSYGIRSYKDFSWIYGTGAAEPRLSQAQIIAKSWKNSMKILNLLG